MDKRLNDILTGKEGNHLLPFFWMHDGRHEVLTDIVSPLSPVFRRLPRHDVGDGFAVSRSQSVAVVFINGHIIRAFRGYSEKLTVRRVIKHAQGR